MASETIKSAETIEQKGVAQLLQIEEVWLKSSKRCGFSQSPHAQEASLFLVFYTVSDTLLRSICCMQTYFYLEEVSRHCQSYLLRSATRKMTSRYLYTTIAHK